MGLGNLISKVFGSGGDQSSATQADPVDYQGYTIIPEPIVESGQYRTAGIIRGERNGEACETRFIRADNTTDRQAAIDHSIQKARQIIDEQGAQVFDREIA